MPTRPPSVDALARSLSDLDLPHPLLVDAARAAVAAGDSASARTRAEAMAGALLRPVINATGVLLHTNLGRAPLGAVESHTYTNLEMDLASGQRGSRRRHAAALLARACGAPSALVVNNGAAAVLLVLAALAAERPVVVSRGELVEIGGGFRVPEVMAQSGARLVEVGTTNRTRLADYRDAVARLAAAGDPPALLLKVHPSNYRIVGFTESVEVAALAGLAGPGGPGGPALEALSPPVVADLGSGLLDAATPWLAGGPPPWLAGEPAVRQTLKAGAALVTFSCDKLLGGPQGGAIAGRRDLVERCAAHPLARALRPGGLVLGALQETALAYLRQDGDAIPFWRMASVPVPQLRARARALGLPGSVEVVDTIAVAGAGSSPGMDIASVGVAIPGDRADALRAQPRPVVARVQAGRTICDLRTVDPADDAMLAKEIAEVCA